MNMATHQELIEEMLIVHNMSTEERLHHARQRRLEQLLRWRDFETERDDVSEVKRYRTVSFGDCVTLLEAAARNDYEEVKELLLENVDPNEANSDGLTALHQACIDNFEDMVELLLDFHANVNAVDSEGWTPLHAACTCAHNNIARILVQRGANMLALNSDQNMPYDICEDNSTLEVVEQAMASKGITQEQIDEARLSREKLLINHAEEMLDKGQDISGKDETGATLLHVAAANGYARLARFLLLNDRNVNVQDSDGWTPLHAAACWCQMEIIEILALEQNADPSTKNSVGETAADVTEDEEIKSLLLKLMKAQKESRKSKVISWSFQRRSDAGRRNSMRRQSFKGRSKRDKKKATSEANVEVWDFTKSDSTAKKSFKIFALTKLSKSFRQKSDSSKEKV